MNASSKISQNFLLKDFVFSNVFLSLSASEALLRADRDS